MRKAFFSFAFAAAVSFGAQWTGYISETKCGKAHQDGSAKSVDCVKMCIKDGAKPVLVADGKVISIANPAKIDEKFYGMKVTLKGDLKGDTVTVDSVAAAK